MTRLFWKLIPKVQRELLLERLSIIDRQVVDKALSGRIRFPQVFDELKCVFIHVPKCAGSSVAMSLFGDTPTGHMPLYWYEKQFPERYAHYLKFGFVRDPLQRAWSAYNYLLNNTQRRDKAAFELVNKYPSFDAFIDNWLHPENISKQIHFVPQHRFLENSIGSIDVDFIGRQESLIPDFLSLCEHLNVKAELQHINRSPGKHDENRDFCSAASRRKVREVYARDYELFSYE
ncbi:sulfotransferase family 2 domain-containing protein [Pseudomonas sp. 10B1]|uniref:sulfotransferase family 2 domain-containing protein n=1 Tax=unclassified Pseudomonas TaxID=196821 RepID=UPI002AB4B8B1|nr:MULTISPECIES: sulfotransferase family 2 domain-containing protein [unclassified Pseudomonas]MDY7562429.1 sulfotransferase family 2 domain-containing protein [Pseudomonas sp. AB6]MEA9978029.1 sulfotransferase family 2 domain-containing protein [Pseudomonas sp. RTS4]MEA9996812.1 sulfotransferase family 2 domain-containing protein [Pseudomonas sp. AA4]MEB0086318.1 sulfotransferase family 2 domain-containing protein [Pseudomonas sp. RTI1]MEB0126483.1 sulfotransferase family 2 domain-containing 